jgi:hypothetical protein
MMKLVLPMVEVMLVMLELYGVLELGVVRCSYITGSCRTFREEAVLQTALCSCEALHWPAGIQVTATLLRIMLF